MPYIAFDLDALAHVPDAARAAGLDEAALGYGLVRLWAYCWKAKTEIVTTSHLKGFFGGVDVSDALVAFEHLERRADGYRVRGAERYLRISEARSKGGKAASGNLKRGRESAEPQPEASRESAGSQPGLQPESSPGCVPALTPSIEHRTPNQLQVAGADAPPPSRKRRGLRVPIIDHPPDPRHAPLVKALCEAWPDYAFQGGRDAKAVTDLLALGEPGEVLARWCKAIVHKTYPVVRELPELVTHWNHFPVPKPPPPPTPAEAWVLEQFRGQGDYIVSQLLQAGTLERTADGVLVTTDDPFHAEWLNDHFGGVTGLQVKCTKQKPEVANG